MNRALCVVYLPTVHIYFHWCRSGLCSLY